MKKSYLLSCLLAGFSLAAVAQQTNIRLQPKQQQFAIPVDPGKPWSPAKSNSTESNWYLPFDASIINSPDQSTFKAYANFIFPDSLAVAVYTTGPGGWGTHGIGSMLDPKDDGYLFLDPAVATLSKYNNYSLDSIYFRYSYVRFLDSLNGNEVVDTLFIQYFQGTGIQKQGLQGGEVFSRPTGYGTSSSHGAILSANAFKTDTLFLTKSDSTGVTIGSAAPSFASKQMIIPVGAAITATPDNLCGFTLTFKPGYAYALGDTLINLVANGTQPKKKMNFFGYRLYRNEDDTSRQVKQTKFYGNSLVYSTESRYPGLSTWQGFIPGNAYFQHQYMESGFHITSTNVGIKNMNGNGYGLGNAYPNPATNNINIPFAIGTAGDVSLTVSSVIGQTMLSTSGQFSKGENNFKVDLNNMKPGVYFYTVSSGNYSATKKFTVTQ